MEQQMKAGRTPRRRRWAVLISGGTSLLLLMVAFVMMLLMMLLMISKDLHEYQRQDAQTKLARCVVAVKRHFLPRFSLGGLFETDVLI